MAAVAVAGHAGSRGAAVAALAILAGILLIGAAAMVWVSRTAILGLPIGRARAVNLRAVRGGAEPALWLVAHLDSKSQPIPIGVRAAGIIATAIIWIFALGVAIGQVIGAPVANWWIAIVISAVLAGLPVAASVVGDRSHGAVDNASGVAAVLVAAELLGDRDGVGVLVTSAEELGLAGARAIASSTPRSVALNCDTVDDGAPMLCLTAGAPRRAAQALVSAARELGVAIGSRRVLPGILVDATAFSDRGWDCATLTAATWRTLGRVHTARDTAAAMRGDGVAVAGQVLAAAARQLLDHVGRRVLA
jgi:hypothetical protein